MLILTRKPGESIYIGDNVKVTIVEIKGHQIRVGIDAPNDLRIYREEIYLQILEENKQAAGAMGVEAGLDNIAAAWKGKGEPRTGLGKLTAIPTPGVKPLTAKPVQPTSANSMSVSVKRKKKKHDGVEDEDKES